MTVSDQANALRGFAQRQVDRVVAPEQRQEAWDRTAEFAVARPLLFTFLLAQLTLSFLPLLIFAAFVLSALAFAAGCAIIFTLFWVGVALLVLVPTLLVTGGTAVLIWAWAVASFVAARWVWDYLPASIRGMWEGEGAPQQQQQQPPQGNASLTTTNGIAGDHKRDQVL